MKVMELFPLTALLRATHLPLLDYQRIYQLSTETHRSDTHINLVHWDAQGIGTKTSAVKTAIVQDDLNIVMIQDTRCKHRLDDLPNLRIQGIEQWV